MAVTYMKKLEEEPETYEQEFTNLTKGINLEINDWIIDRINNDNSIFEIGCGPGTLAARIAKQKGKNVIAIDKNFQMINYAMANYPSDIAGKLLYQIGSFNNLTVFHSSQDLVISTFMLSELRPLEQQIFLRNVWKILKKGGRLIIATEFMPLGIWKIGFSLRRWRYKKKIRRYRLKNTQLNKYFFNYLNPIGFKITDKKTWKHNSIQVIELVKFNNEGKEEPGYYQPKMKKYKGILSQFRIFRCIFTGQIDRVPIEPGIYQSGNPTRKSPIIVTANYDFTYIKVMRDLKDIDVWVLVIDTNGINVWCAARGNDFGNQQVLEAIEATGVQNYTKNELLLLPQLSAGGVSMPNLSKKSKNFPFKAKYGPIWSKYIPEYLKNKPVQKPANMKLAKFNIFHRTRAFITHTTFLLRKVFFYPIIASLIIFLVVFPWFNKLYWVIDFILWIITSNLIISFLFPLSNFTRKFILKGLVFGIITIIILGGTFWILQKPFAYILLNTPMIFWISFFSTMSFSGYSMSTSPREIQEEYGLFTKVNKILLVISVISSLISILLI
jgi:ubiquinone/menaquinone biosynthesis C-methylase UbiE